MLICAIAAVVMFTWLRDMRKLLNVEKIPDVVKILVVCITWLALLSVSRIFEPEGDIDWLGGLFVGACIYVIYYCSNKIKELRE